MQRHPEIFETDIPILNGALKLIQPAVFAGQRDLYNELTTDLHWRQDKIRIHGKDVPIPRLQAWYGESHCLYSYSGLTMEPQGFPQLLAELKVIAEKLSNARFNCVLCNYYRDGKDSVAWHADDERELGRNPTVASFSFGSARRFLIKPKKGKAKAMPIILSDNSLLIMSGEMQHYWLHQLPKTRQPVSGRVNLTYRYIQHPGDDKQQVPLDH